MTDWKERAERAEAELARLRAQEPVAWHDDEWDCAYTAVELDGGTAEGLTPLYRAAPPAQPAEPPRCKYCDGTGDVHTIDGVWRGRCTECDGAQPAEPVQRLSDSGLRDKIHDALASELSWCAYDCTRVWEAWSVGTMTQDDFTPVDERLGDIVSTVLAAIKPALQPGWRDIESAPKDGTHVLLWCPTHIQKGVQAMPFTGRWFSGGPWVIVNADMAIQRVEPTHWMALPPAPKATK